MPKVAKISVKINFDQIQGTMSKIEGGIQCWCYCRLWQFIKLTFPQCRQPNQPNPPLTDHRSRIITCQGQCPVSWCNLYNLVHIQLANCNKWTGMINVRWVSNNQSIWPNTNKDNLTVVRQFGFLCLSDIRWILFPSLSPYSLHSIWLNTHLYCIEKNCLD